jgi:alkylation response protein AidB-like acyl-CoA dehydrogenase
MTDAMARVLERHGRSEEARMTMAHLTTADTAQLWEGAMFLTEKQGGSDVGANEVQATRSDNEEWLLNGNKWFCSNADAKAILVLARMPGGPQGTKGLGLFLVLTEHPVANKKNMVMLRLKDKLGVRSMPSAEIDFVNCRAFLIGGENEGFKMMADMVNLSRVYNSISSVAIVRRGLLEAILYARQRKAFGSNITDLPLWRACYSDLAAEHMAHTLLVFETVAQLDQGDCGNKEAVGLSRLMTSVSKALTGKLVMFATSECMELIGGNAYIEEHIMPRLLRDAQVLPIWEGTTNIQSLDTLRVFSKEGPGAYIHRVEQALATAEKAQVPLELIQVTKHRFKNWQALADAMRTLTEAQMQYASRTLLEESGRVMMTALLLEKAAEPALRDIMLAYAWRLRNRRFATSPLATHLENEAIAAESLILESATN